MNIMTITSSKYLLDMEGNNSSVLATIDGQVLYVPVDAANRHYAEILKQVSAGTLTIAAAD